ncbi:hypothetical protein AB1Y20_009206 [Prymnesium parvum]
MPKKVLIVLTSVDKYPDGSPTGWYLPEAVHPFVEFRRAGFEVEFASITGLATCDPSSIDASKDDKECTDFWSDPTLKAKTESTKKLADCKPDDYSAVFFAGGFGVMWDFPENPAAIKLITDMLAANKPVAAVCHGPIVFKNVKDAEGKPVLAGKDCTGFTNAEEKAVNKYAVVSEPSGPGSCEDVLGALGNFKDGGVFQPNVCVAGYILTGQNPPSAQPLAKEVIVAIGKSTALIEALKKAGIAGTFLACLDMSDTMVFPFLGEFFVHHGISKAFVGFIFGIMSVGMLIFCPIVPYFMPKIGGPAKTLLLGTLLFATVRIGTASMGLFHEEDEGENGMMSLSADYLVWYSSILFFLTGCVYSFTEIGGLAWILMEAPEGGKSKAMAAMMTARMIGGLVGTPLGGILFDLIGWAPTNLACTLLLLIPSAMFYKTLAQPVPQRAAYEANFKLYMDKKFALSNLLSLLSLAAMYAYVPYLQLFYADQFSISKSVWGLIFMVGVIVGFLVGAGSTLKVEEYMGTLNAIIAGFGMFSVGYLLLGPSPILAFLPHSGWPAFFISTGGWFILLLGNGGVVTILPTLLLKYAMEFGLDEEDASVQSATVNIFMMAAGLFFGPTFGGYFAHAIGVPWTNTLLAIIICFCGYSTCAFLKSEEKTSKVAKSQEMM